ncbi:MAG: 4Fe-4S dicluster domain-containing protein, partial [Verrucomicrobiota bacterium]
RFAGFPKPAGPELIQETFRQIAKPTDFTAAWATFLHDGFLGASAAKPEELAVVASVSSYAQENFKTPSFDSETFEVVLTSDSKMVDGRHANNGWLQELPDPITKVSWDNVALISPASARKWSAETGDIVEITYQEQTIRIPLFIAPGHADASLSIALGYGRDFAGRVGGKDAQGKSAGFNVYPLMTTAQPYILMGATVKKTHDKYALAITQEHGTLEGRGGDLLREGTIEEFKKTPDFAKTMGMDSHAEWESKDGKKVKVVNHSLYSNPPLTNIHQWGMTVDLSTCTGCSACMVACQAENNIPVVGKEQVAWGREMHWIRTDRYFASENDETADPEMIYQPMLCQHCENAPCETVCPVNATVHSDDGLNVMAYNRCIGTRYCANNCPFKVRRFNFFDYNQRKIEDHGLYKWNLIAPKGTEETVKMQK